MWHVLNCLLILFIFYILLFLPLLTLPCSTLFNHAVSYLSQAGTFDQDLEQVLIRNLIRICSCFVLASFWLFALASKQI